MNSRLDFERFIQDFTEGPAIFCSLAIGRFSSPVEIISNSRIHYCETCQLNFQSEAKKRSHIQRNDCTPKFKGK